MPHIDLPPLGPRILFLDAYDSFSNNIVALLEIQLSARVTTIKIDEPPYLDSPGAFNRLLKEYDAVVAGPGPGSPILKKDVGLISRLWTLADEDLIPVLGICLGFQSLAYAFGAQIQQMKEPKHGVVQGILCKNADIFEASEGIKGGIISTQYHSLHAQLNPYGEARSEEELWKISRSCPNLQPLAWVPGLQYACRVEPEDDIDDTLMAVRHLTKPFWGVQFHPESICSQLDVDANFIKNWWKLSQQWSKTHNRVTAPPKSLLQKRKRLICDNPGRELPCPRAPRTVEWASLPLGNANTVKIVEALQAQDQRSVVLESGMLQNERPVNPETGRFTIIGALNNCSTQIEYRSAIHEVTRHCGGPTRCTKPEIVHAIFPYLKDFMGQHAAQEGPKDVPFWGGLVGFISYEACLSTINVDLPVAGNGRPDMTFVFVERSVVIDHIADQIYIQSVHGNDNAWLMRSKEKLEAMTQPSCPASSAHSPKKVRANTSAAAIHGPTEQDYRSKVLSCQTEIRSGESYELCLTDTTRVESERIDAWSSYKRLRDLNPAPFSAYLNLITLDARSSSTSITNNITILSSSPERFMSWSRPRSWNCAENTTTSTQYVQFRPIKGTLRKSPLSPIDREKAFQLLNTRKERAENIMIVDLIRHDLHGVVGAGNVEVTKLCSVEEYETVWQLVSVIEGQITNNTVHEPIDAKKTVTIADLDEHKAKHIRQLHERELPLQSPSGEYGIIDSPYEHPLLQLAKPSDRKTPRVSTQEHEEIDNEEEEHISPIDVLAASLPPGSMTGAPKKRSCQILQQLEGQPRGIYSGILGYLDVGGGGDFSVLIRTAWHWGDDVVKNGAPNSHEGENTFSGANEDSNNRSDDADHGLNGNGEQNKHDKEIWHIGAGGAITSQSTDEGEWEEMLTKRAAVLRLFTEDED